MNKAKPQVRSEMMPSSQSPSRSAVLGEAKAMKTSRSSNAPQGRVFDAEPKDRRHLSHLTSVQPPDSGRIIVLRTRCGELPGIYLSSDNAPTDMTSGCFSVPCEPRRSEMKIGELRLSCFHSTISELRSNFRLLDG